MGLSEEELIPLSLYKVDESMSSDAEGSFYLSISFAHSSRHGSKEELDTGDPYWEFINKPKYPKKKKKVKRTASQSTREKMRKERMKRKTRRMKTTNLLMMVMTTRIRIFCSSDIQLYFVFF